MFRDLHEARVYVGSMSSIWDKETFECAQYLLNYILVEETKKQTKFKVWFCVKLVWTTLITGLLVSVWYKVY